MSDIKKIIWALSARSFFFSAFSIMMRAFIMGKIPAKPVPNCFFGQYPLGLLVKPLLYIITQIFSAAPLFYP